MGWEAEISRWADDLNLAVTNALLTDVADIVRGEIANAVQTEVYDVYEPAVYRRKGANDGLKDFSNMEATVADIGKGTKELAVTDLRMDEKIGRFVAPIVESGEGYVYDFDWNGIPRPFHSVAQERLDQTEIENALANSLRSWGFKL